MDVLQQIIPTVEPQSCIRHIWQFVVGLRPSRFPVVCVSQFLHDDYDSEYVSLSNLSTWQDQSHISVTQTVYGSDDKIAFLSTKSITNLTGYASWMWSIRHLWYPTKYDNIITQCMYLTDLLHIYPTIFNKREKKFTWIYNRPLHS